MYFCRSCFEGAALYSRQGGAFFECCLCGHKYTPEEVRGPFSVVEGGSGNVLQRGRPFDLQDRCLNPWCDSVTWAFVDDPAPGRTHRKCCECSEDWPEVPYTADRCFWCHDTRTVKRTRDGKTRLECLSCRREWLHPDAPAPVVVTVRPPVENNAKCHQELNFTTGPQPFYRKEFVGGGCTPKEPAPNLQGFAMWAYTMNRLGGRI